MKHTRTLSTPGLGNINLFVSRHLPSTHTHTHSAGTPAAMCTVRVHAQIPAQAAAISEELERI